MQNQDVPAGLRRMLRLNEVERTVGLKRTRIDDLMREGKFPRPVKIGDRAIAWLESELIEWQNARVAERDSATA